MSPSKSKARRKSRSQNRSQSQSQSQSQNRSPSQQQKAPPKRERGTLLTILLVLIIASGIFTAIGFFSLRPSNSPVSAPVLIAMGLTHAVLNVIAAFGIWKWKKWGIYLLGASALLGVVAGLIAVGPAAVFAMVLPLVMVAYLLQSKQSAFE